jgi:hypothetical protein
MMKVKRNSENRIIKLLYSSLLSIFYSRILTHMHFPLDECVHIYLCVYLLLTNNKLEANLIF